MWIQLVEEDNLEKIINCSLHLDVLTHEELSLGLDVILLDIHELIEGEGFGLLG
jgi:hypothetical protein